MTPPTERILSIVTECPVCEHDGQVFLHMSLGRVVDALAGRFRKVLLCCPTRRGKPDAARDYRLSGASIESIPQPDYPTSIAALRRLPGIVAAYWRVCQRSDALFVRGMVPFVGFLYLFAALRGLRPAHWIVGNPVALLRSHRRSGAIMDAAAIAYALQDRAFAKLGRWLTGGTFLCNGRELTELYRSPRTRTVISSTVTEEEFFERPDTCQGPVVRILFVGFIRPEKGLQYLVQALGKLRTDRPWELVIVGPWEDHPAYRRKVDDLTERLGIADRIRWEGYVPYGPEMWRYLRGSDIFVLPTLSEGTPRVLVEARANSLPVVATNVGGIPSSVTDGFDGLLVPPKDPAALARAIDRIIEDGALRRRLIRNGLARVRRFTINHFVGIVLEAMDD